MVTVTGEGIKTLLGSSMANFAISFITSNRYWKKLKFQNYLAFCDSTHILPFLGYYSTRKRFN